MRSLWSRFDLQMLKCQLLLPSSYQANPAAVPRRIRSGKEAMKLSDVGEKVAARVSDLSSSMLSVLRIDRRVSPDRHSRRIRGDSTVTPISSDEGVCLGLYRWQRHG